MRHHRMALFVAVVVLLSFSILACSGTGPSPEPTGTPPPSEPTPVPTPTAIPPTPTPELKEPNYFSDALGISLWYPETWVQEEMSDAVAFASSASLWDDNWETGAALAVFVMEFEEGQTTKEAIQQLLDESYLEDVETSEFEPISIGDDRGVITSLEAKPMDTSFELKGFMAGVEHNRLAYVFMGISVKGDWAEYGETLDAMLRSVRFTEPEGTYTSEDLGLKIWYPEGWGMEEDRDQIVFATSEDVINTGDLEAGAAFMIRSSSMRDVLLEDWFEEEATLFTFDSGGPTSDVGPQKVAGYDGLTFELEGVPSGTDTEIKGFVAAVEYEGWGYLFLAVAAVDEWADYGPILDEMLSSVEFVE
jgi:hypothetical protein